MKQLAPIMILALVLCCCKENPDVLTFGKCLGSVLTDSLSIRAKIPGTWKWTERYCPCCPHSVVTMADKAVIATFKTDTTFSVTENQQVVITGSWKVVKSGNAFVLSITKTQPNSYFYLDGSITLCDSQLMADATPFDGCDHLFVKM